MQKVGESRVDLLGGFDVEQDNGVEAGKGIIAGDVGILLLVDVLLVVLLADRVDPRQYIDHAHLSFPDAVWNKRRKGIKKKRKKYVIKKKEKNMSAEIA